MRSLRSFYFVSGGLLGEFDSFSSVPSLQYYQTIFVFPLFLSVCSLALYLFW